MAMLTDFTNWLNNNPWLNLVFLVLAFGGILVSVLLYFRSKREKRPCYDSRTFQLIKDSIGKIEAVEIKYKGQRIQNLSMTKLALWNAGRDTINANDVAPKDPIRAVVAAPTVLLGMDVTYVANPVNNFSITGDLDKGEVKIDFDYFHQNEGVVIAIYHTGRTGDDIKVVGTIKSVPTIQKIRPENIRLDDAFAKSIDAKLDQIKPKPLRLIVMFIAGLFLIPVMVLLFLVDFILPRYLPPKELRVG